MNANAGIGVVPIITIELKGWEKEFDELHKRIKELCKERDIARKNGEDYWAEVLTQHIDKLNEKRLAIAMKHIK